MTGGELARYASGSSSASRSSSIVWNRAVGLLGQAAQDDLLDRRRDVRVDAARRRRRLRHLLDQDLAHRLAVERQLRRSASGTAARRARRCRCGGRRPACSRTPRATCTAACRAPRRPRSACARRASAKNLARPKSSTLTKSGIAEPLDQHDVVGLEIAVDDARRVRRGERVGDLRADVQRARRRRARLAAPSTWASVRPSRYSMMKKCSPSVGLAEVVDLDDVLVADLVDRARLVEEALTTSRLPASSRWMTLSATFLPISGCSARIHRAHPARRRSATGSGSCRTA